MITIPKKRKRTQHHSRRCYDDPFFQPPSGLFSSFSHLNPITRGGNHSQLSISTMPVNINSGRHDLGLLSSSSHYLGGKQRKLQQPCGGNNSQSLVSTMPVNINSGRHELGLSSSLSHYDNRKQRKQLAAALWWQ